MTRRTQRPGLAVAFATAACHATEPLPPPPSFAPDERSAVLFVEPTPDAPIAFAWDADALSPGDLPAFTGDSGEPRLHWVTFACALDALGLDGPLELGDGPGEVPAPVRQLQMVNRRWAPATDVDRLLAQLPVTRADFCRAQASAVAVTATRLHARAAGPSGERVRTWTAALDTDTVLYVQTIGDEDEPPANADSAAFVTTVSALRDIAAGRTPSDAANAPGLTSGAAAAGAFTVVDEANQPTSTVLWVEPGRIRWLEIHASGEPTAQELGRWAHPALRDLDRVEASARARGSDLEALVLVASPRPGDRYVSTLLSIRDGALATVIPTSTVPADIPLDLIELPSGDALVRGAAPGLAEGDRLLRVSGGELVGSAVERLPPDSATCPVQRVLGDRGVDLFVGAGPGCRSTWSVRVVERGAAEWTAAPSAPPLSTASARRADAVFRLSSSGLHEERPGVGRCPISTDVAPDARAGSWAPAAAPDTWVLFSAADAEGVDVQIWDVVDRGPRCEAE